jgi:hypothetical protein
MALVLAFYSPRYWFVPVVLEAASFLAQIFYLTGVPTPIPLPWLAVALGAVLLYLMREFVLRFVAPPP